MLNLIPSVLDVGELFDDGRTDQYALKGCVVYWGAHYFTFTRIISEGREHWVQFNVK